MADRSRILKPSQADKTIRYDVSDSEEFQILNKVSQTDSITYGFRAILSDPAVFLMELVWRWSFGTLAFLLLVFAGLTLLGSADVADVRSSEWNNRDPLVITLAALRLVRALGRRPLFYLIAIAITVLWIVLGTVGRTITLRRISQAPYSIKFRNMLALQAWRAVFLWVGIAGTAASLMFCAWMATHGSRPDYVIFYVMVIPLLAVIAIFCSVVNWYLSLAFVCSQSNETGSVAIQRAMVLTGSHPAAVAGISIVFTVLRVLALLITFVLAVFSAGLLVSSPRLLVGWLALVALAYCAWADFLYVCRLASYATLRFSVSQPATNPSVVPMPETPLTTTPNGHH
ncbi:MAG TPA: hypothetical protein VG649_19760 [Candidatus Angelobacter sp.]|nr:hypothetical protein [Candidatus Angelobacter sp.]